MNRRPSYTRMLAIVMMSGLVACAGVPTQEMSNARQALQAARAANADTHAAKSFSEAEQRLSKAERELSGQFYARARKDAVIARSDAITARNIALAIAEARAAVAAAEAEGAVSSATRDWLAKAESAAAAVREDDAVLAAGRAKEQAEDDLHAARETRRGAEQENQAWLDQAEPLLREARQAEARMTPSQHDRLIDADAAFRHGQGKHAHELAAALLADLMTVRDAPSSNPTATVTYRSVRGDSLWKIAGRRDVYGNSLWWPLIFAANHDRIKDPDLILPGQVFVIDLHPDDAAVARAVTHAQRRGPWSFVSFVVCVRVFLWGSCCFFAVFVLPRRPRSVPSMTMRDELQ